MVVMDDSADTGTRECIPHGEVHICIGAEVDHLVADKVSVVGHIAELRRSRVVVCTHTFMGLSHILCLNGRPVVSSSWFFKCLAAKCP